MKFNRPKPLQKKPQDSKLVFKGKLFDVYQWQQEMYDGSFQTFENIKRADTVNVIPVTIDKKIIITKQEQPGKKPFYAFAGGRIDDGEDPFKAGERELVEETGYKPDKIELLDAYQITSKIDWVNYDLIAKGCTNSLKTKLDPGEKVEVFEVEFDVVLQMIFDGKFEREKELVIRFLRAMIDNKLMDELKRKLFD